MAGNAKAIAVKAQALRLWMHRFGWLEAKAIPDLSSQKWRPDVKDAKSFYQLFFELMDEVKNETGSSDSRQAGNSQLSFHGSSDSIVPQDESRPETHGST